MDKAPDTWQIVQGGGLALFSTMVYLELREIRKLIMRVLLRDHTKHKRAKTAPQEPTEP